MPPEDPPRDREEFWIRFGFALVFFGGLFALLGIRFIDSAGVLPTLVIWGLSSVSISAFAAWHGDDAWRRICGFLRWW